MTDLVIRSLSEIKIIVVEKMDEGTVLSVSFAGKEPAPLSDRPITCQDDAVEEIQKMLKDFDREAFCILNTEYLLFRGLDERLVDWLIDNEMLYESSEHHSAVFVGHNADGKPAHGAYRSTDNSGYKGDYSGSNKRFCFRLEREKSNEVYVFESAIDLLSFVTFMIEDGFDCSMKSFISTAGVSAPNNPDDMKIPAALDEFLSRHPETDHVFLCFDSDEVGRKSAMALVKKLEGRCYKMY